MPTLGAYADPARTGRERTTHAASALTLASSQAPARAGALPHWTRTISSWHNIHPFYLSLLRHSRSYSLSPDSVLVDRTPTWERDQLSNVSTWAVGPGAEIPQAHCASNQGERTVQSRVAHS